MPKAKSKSRSGVRKGRTHDQHLPLSLDYASFDTITLQDFKLWSDPALKAFLSLRRKDISGTHEELAARAYIACEDQVAVNPSEEHALRSNLKEYKERLKVGPTVLPDPFTLKDGWLAEDGRANWPSMYFCDITNFLQMTTPTELYNRLCNEYKQGKAYRYFTSGWVKEVFYHPVSETSDTAFLAAKVLPSMRLNAGTYQAWVAVKKDKTGTPGGKIVAAYCTCTAGLKGSCNHVIGLCFRVEYAVRSGLTQPSCTSKPCTWNAPAKQDACAPMKLTEQIWKRDQYFSQGNDDHQKSVKHLATQFTPMSKRQEDYVGKDKMLNDLAKILREEAPNSCFIQLYDKVPFTAPNKILCPPSPCEVAKTLEQPATVEELKNAMTLSTSDIECIEKASVGQSETSIWSEQRAGRVTSSQFHRVKTRATTLTKNPNADPNPLIKTIMGYDSRAKTMAMKHGLAMEPIAKRKYTIIQAKVHKKFSTKNSGLVVSKPDPMLAASPDLIVSCQCSGTSCEGGTGLCEIKCPETIKHEVPTAENWPHLIITEGKTQLAKSSQYYSQVQGQMAITGHQYCDFFVFTSHGHHLERIAFDTEYWDTTRPLLLHFWERFVAPELMFGSIAMADSPQIDIETEHNYNKTGPTAPLNQQSTPSKPSSSKGPLSLSKMSPVYICGICMADINEEPTCNKEESIECSGCQVWYHIQCVQVQVTHLKDKDWLCTSCLT